MRLLVTRPEPDAQRTAAALRARGHDVLLMPILQIEAIAAADLGRGPWAGVLMTSANAARAIATHRQSDTLRALPAFVVGERTREAAQASGFANIAASDGDAAALAQLVATRASPTTAPLLYLAGEQRTGDLEAALRSHGYEVHTVVIYRATASTELSSTVTAALMAGEVDGILHFSKRSAEAFVAAAAASGALDNVMALRHYCLSAQVAAALGGKIVAGIVVAPRPDERALIELVV
jgi:uroporphyrinogen-III synthase